MPASYKDSTSAAWLSRVMGWVNGSGVAVPVDPTNPLPTGGNVASGATDSGNPVKVGGVVSTSTPNYSNGQRGNFRMTPSGDLYIVSGNISVALMNADGNSPTVAGQISGSYSHIFNGATWDRARGDINGTWMSGAGHYETVAASQSDQILGATGAVGDYLQRIIIVPATTTPGAVSIKDGNGSAITVFAGGTVTVAPIVVDIGMKTVNATTPGWKVTTGTNVSVIGIGRFT